MANVKLNAEIRETKKTGQLREDGFVPAVLYGPETKENKNLKIKKGEFEKAYNQAGEYSLIDLKINKEEPVKILIKDIQRDAIKDDFIHVDFYQVNMNEKITTEIPINFTGESKAIKELGGFLVKNLYEVEVECYPGDLVDEIIVDISKLETFEDYIRIKDLEIPKGLEFTGDEEEMVVNVTPPEEEKEETEEEVPSEEGEEEDGDKKGEEDEEKSEGKDSKDEKQEEKK
jgi:large subunit ribosomal protein L25